MMKKRLYIFFSMSVLLLLPIIFFRDFTPANELRYLSIADEALKNGTLFAFTNHEIPYADKPPLYLWIVMVARTLAGAHYLWLLSLFSLLPAFGIIWIMNRWVGRYFSDEQKYLASIILLSTGLFLISSLMVRMDMLMCFFIVAALYMFWSIFNGAQEEYRIWLFSVFIFLAVFTKGPFGLLIPLLSTAVFLFYSGHIKSFFKFWSWKTWGMLILLSSLWFSAVYVEGGAGYLNNLLFHQTIDRAVNSFHHNQPFYYYALSMWYFLVPWSFLIVAYIVVGFKQIRERDNIQSFFLIIVIVIFLLLSAVSGKLDVYFLPAVPFAVYAVVFQIGFSKRQVLTKICIAIPASLFVAVFPTLILLNRHNFFTIPSSIGIWITSGVISLAGVLALWCLFGSKSSVRKSIESLTYGLIIVIFVVGMQIRNINPYIGYGEVCRTAIELAKAHDVKEIATWEISRSENMDVYLGKEVNIITDSTYFISSQNKSFILITQKEKPVNIPYKKAVDVGEYVVYVTK